MTDTEIVGWILDTLERGAVGRAAPADRGGFTQWGVTRVAYADYWRVAVTQITDEMIRTLTRPEAEDIWLELFVRRTKFDRIADWRLRLALVQWAGNAGAGTVIRQLQRLLGVTVDGVVGRQTLAAVAKADPVRLRERVLAAQCRAWRALMLRAEDQRANAPGWLKRLADVLEAA